MDINIYFCPYCKKGFTVIEGHGSESLVTCCCYVCGRYYEANTQTKTTNRVTAHKKAYLSRVARSKRMAE